MFVVLAASRFIMVFCLYGEVRRRYTGYGHQSTEKTPKHHNLARFVLSDLPVVVVGRTCIEGSVPVKRANIPAFLCLSPASCVWSEQASVGGSVGVTNIR